MNSVNSSKIHVEMFKHLVSRMFIIYYNWKNHIDLMIPKLSRVCCAIRAVSYISSADTFKSIYFAYFHSIMKYGIFLGVSPPTVK
jgi:hypothetical protein